MSAATDNARMQALEGAVQDIRSAINQIAEAMVKIARLEERHEETRGSLGRAFDRIEAVEKTQADQRVDIVKIQGELAPLKESRGWTVNGILAVVAVVGAAVIGLVVVKASGG
jgi:uncharacterized protein involved in exopolysaccharide biosynthesis